MSTSTIAAHLSMKLKCSILAPTFFTMKCSILAPILYIFMCFFTIVHENLSTKLRLLSWLIQEIKPSDTLIVLNSYSDSLRKQRFQDVPFLDHIHNKTLVCIAHTVWYMHWGHWLHSPCNSSYHTLHNSRLHNTKDCLHILHHIYSYHSNYIGIYPYTHDISSSRKCHKS